MQGCRCDIQLQLLDGAVVDDAVDHLVACHHGLNGTLILAADGLAHLAVNRQQPDVRPAQAHVARIAHRNDVVVVVPAGHEEFAQVCNDLTVEVADV